MKILSTHEYVAFIFQDEQELDTTIKGLQRLRENCKEWPAIQLHYSAAYDGNATACIKRLKYIYKNELPAKAIPQTPVWEEDSK